MSNLDSIVTLEYHNKRYSVCSIVRQNQKLPILLDRDVYKIISRLDKKWYVNDKNHVYCIHNRDDTESGSHPVYLHEVVARIGSMDVDKKDNTNGASIIHTNNIHFDNRLENLQFDIRDKDYAKNTRKKKRIIDLEDHGIDVDELPTYLWYLKPDRTHGDRFAVEIPQELSWRSTASRKVSLRYKLEEAKKYLRHMKEARPDIFEAYSMNGDLTGLGQRLHKDYVVMVKKAGFTINNITTNKTDEILEEDTTDLTDFEICLLHSFDPNEGYIDVNRAQRHYDDVMFND